MRHSVETILDYSRKFFEDKLKTRLEQGYDIQNSGIVLIDEKPYWWAIVTKNNGEASDQIASESNE